MVEEFHAQAQLPRSFYDTVGLPVLMKNRNEAMRENAVA